MLELEKNLIRRLGPGGWVLYWLPKIHTLSKVYSVDSPPYRKEGHLLAKKIDAVVDSVHRKMKADLEKRKNLPPSNINRLSRDGFQRKMAEINRKRTAQKTNYLRDKIRESATSVEINLMFDGFDAGMSSFGMNDYAMSDGGKFIRVYIEQDRPEEPGKLASLYHQVRRETKRKRRDWVPDESKYIENFIRNIKGHFRRLFSVSFWDGVEYHADLAGGTPGGTPEGRKEARAKGLSSNEIGKIMDVLFFKFDHHPVFPMNRNEYDEIKDMVAANYNYSTQLSRESSRDGVIRERYVKPSIRSIRQT